MTPLEKVYWLRVALGVVAALLCAGFGVATGRIHHINPAEGFPDSASDISLFMNSLSLAIIVYLISHFMIKRRFILLVEKPQKIFTTGIGIYFIAWLVFWALLYTTIAVI
jgi:hypothetical protein